jgi:glycosyltransferase involved in cell wall biosynthesis
MGEVIFERQNMEYKKPVKVSAIVSCFRGQKYLPAFLENCAQQTLAEQLEVVLVHNDPSPEELELVRFFETKHPGMVTHLVVGREPLAVSTNRAMKAAKGEYLCVWNVDDLRTPDSLEKMAAVLDNFFDIGFTYGDFIITHKWLGKTGQLVVSPEFARAAFVRSMHAGPFYMWRKQLCETLGYWDEQFKSGADFDYVVRLALESKGKKTIGLLGYYLDEGIGLSTGKTPWQAIERTMIELRYGVYRKLDFWYYKRAKAYRLNEVLQDGQWRKLSELSPHAGDFREGWEWKLFAFVRYPFWLCKRILNKLKRTLL